MGIEWINITLKSGKEFTFKKENLYIHLWDKEQRKVIEGSLEKCLHCNKFLKVGGKEVTEEYIFNVSDISYIKIYEKHRKKKRKDEN